MQTIEVEMYRAMSNADRRLKSKYDLIGGNDIQTLDPPLRTGRIIV
jgi:hypothetical protein